MSDSEEFERRARAATLEHAQWNPSENGGEHPGVWSSGAGTAEGSSSLAVLPTKDLDKVMTWGDTTADLSSEGTSVITFTTDNPEDSFAISLIHDKTFTMASRYEVEKAMTSEGMQESKSAEHDKGVFDSPWSLPNDEAELSFLGVN